MWCSFIKVYQNSIINHFVNEAFERFYHIYICEKYIKILMSQKYHVLLVLSTKNLKDYIIFIVTKDMHMIGNHVLRKY